MILKIRYRNGKVNIVGVFKHKDNGLFSYVNLTKKHICTCKFESMQEALRDLGNYKNKIEKVEIVKMGER